MPDGMYTVRTGSTGLEIVWYAAKVTNCYFNARSTIAFRAYLVRRKVQSRGWFYALRQLSARKIQRQNRSNKLCRLSATNLRFDYGPNQREGFVHSLSERNVHDESRTTVLREEIVPVPLICFFGLVGGYSNEQKRACPGGAAGVCGFVAFLAIGLIGGSLIILFVAVLWIWCVGKGGVFTCATILQSLNEAVASILACFCCKCGNNEPKPLAMQYDYTL